MALGDKTIKIIGGSIIALGLMYGVPSCVKWTIEEVNRGRDEYFDSFKGNSEPLQLRDTIPSHIEYNVIQRSA
jgi:hypothetical protein